MAFAKITIVVIISLLVVTTMASDYCGKVWTLKHAIILYYSLVNAN